MPLRALIGSSARDGRPERQPQPVLLDADLHHLVDQRDLEVQSRHRRGVILAEPEHDRLLVRLDRVGDVREQPERQDQPDDPGEERQVSAARARSACAPRGRGADIRRMAPCWKPFSLSFAESIAETKAFFPLMTIAIMRSVIGKRPQSVRCRIANLKAIEGWDRPKLAATMPANDRGRSAQLSIRDRPASKGNPLILPSRSVRARMCGVSVPIQSISRPRLSD